VASCDAAAAGQIIVGIVAVRGDEWSTVNVAERKVVKRKDKVMMKKEDVTRD
jgi:hypothetical protein